MLGPFSLSEIQTQFDGIITGVYIVAGYAGELPDPYTIDVLVDQVEFII